MPRSQPPPDQPFLFLSDPACAVTWEPDPYFRLATPEEVERGRCRRHGCSRAPVAAMKRSRRARLGGRSDVWWLYCDWHLYGRRIANGRVECPRRTPDQEEEVPDDPR